MNKNARLLLEFVEQDYGISGTGNYYRAKDHDSLVIDIRNGIFFWNSKGIYGDPVDYLTKVRHMRYTDALELSRLSVGKTPDHFEHSYSDVRPYKELVNVFHKQSNTYESREYWYRRGILDSTIDKLKLGYNLGWNTVPILENGKLLNIQLRRDRPQKRTIPYYRSKPVLYNADILGTTEHVVICEGIVDCIFLGQLEIPCVSKLGGALTWLPEWFYKFINHKQIYLIFDNDDAGRKGAIKVAENLGTSRCKIYTFEDYPEKYDVIDFFRDGHTGIQFVNKVIEESKYTFEIY